MTITIIIPAYNEDKTIGKILQKIARLKLPKGYKKEIIVIDDGSTDKTQVIIEEAREYLNFKLITNKKNLGKGASVIKGIESSKGEIILIQDADLEYDPNDIPRLLNVLKDENAKVVYGSRSLKNNPTSHWTFNWGGRLITEVTNILYGTKLTDEPTGYKVFKREALSGLKLKSKGFEFCPEITAKIAKKGIFIHEIAINYHPRPVSQKKIKWHDGLMAIYYLIKYKFTN